MKEAKDLSGMRFGRLTAIEKAPFLKNRRVVWHCVCDCGNEVNVLASSLQSGNTNSCGCLRADLSSDRRTKDIVGERFGRLVVAEFIARRRRKNGLTKRMYRCTCDCGREVAVSSADLMCGNTRSCGCLKHDGAVLRLTKHGLSCGESGKKERLPFKQSARNTQKNANSGQKNIGGLTMELIDREALIAALDENVDVLKHARELIRMTVIEAPTIDAVPVVHARWIPTDMGGGEPDEAYRCSNCQEPWFLEDGTPKDNKMNYCPNCGAKMDGKEQG